MDFLKKKLNKRARSAVAFGRTAAFDYNDDWYAFLSLTKSFGPQNF